MRFLQTMQTYDGQPVIDFAFGTVPYLTVKKRSNGWVNMVLQDVSNSFRVGDATNLSFHGVPRNLLNVTGTDFLVVDSY